MHDHDGYVSTLDSDLRGMIMVAFSVDRTTGEESMNLSLLTPDRIRLRSNIRNFLMVATKAELDSELALSVERGDEFRADCIRELINEDFPGTYINFDLTT